MSFFSKLFGKSKDPSSYSFRLEKAKSLHGQAVKYVTENRDGNEYTQKEVADLLGISQSYISRLEKKIMKRLRKEMLIA